MLLVKKKFSLSRGVVYSSDWGRLGGRVLIIWMLWSRQSRRISKEAGSDIKHRGTSTEPLQDYFQEQTVLLNNRHNWIFFSIFTRVWSRSKFRSQATPPHTLNYCFLASTLNLQLLTRHLSGDGHWLVGRETGGICKSGLLLPAHPICWVWDADFNCWRCGGGSGSGSGDELISLIRWLSSERGPKASTKSFIFFSFWTQSLAWNWLPHRRVCVCACVCCCSFSLGPNHRVALSPPDTDSP